MNKSQRDNRANQLNPNNKAYYSSRGINPPDQKAKDNRANQLNPNNRAYYSSRGIEPPSPSKGGGKSGQKSSRRKKMSRSVFGCGPCIII